MNKKQAYAEAFKRWGKNAAVQDLGRQLASNPERRAAAHANLQALRAKHATHEERKAYRKEMDEAFSEAVRFRFSVGELSWIAFHVKGQGDTWEDAFAKADK